MRHWLSLRRRRLRHQTGRKRRKHLRCWRGVFLFFCTFLTPPPTTTTISFCNYLFRLHARAKTVLAVLRPIWCAVTTDSVCARQQYARQAHTAARVWLAHAPRPTSSALTTKARRCALNASPARLLAPPHSSSQAQLCCCSS